MSSPLHDANQILALAPDPTSAKAGSQLSAAHHGSNLGSSEAALWGECQDLGLYLFKAAEPALFKDSGEPQWVSDWLGSRQARQEKKADKCGG